MFIVKLINKIKISSILLKKATQNFALLFFILSIYHNTAYTQDTISTNAKTIDSTSTFSDTIKISKKELRTEKTKKAFKFLSYFNYNDRGYGKDFSGIEQYEPFKDKNITCVDIVIFKPFGCTQDSCPDKLSKGQKFGNAIHFKAKEWFVKGDIFFKEGDKINPILFADTERQLWKRNKFKEVKIIIVTDSIQPENAEVMVFLQDKLSWTASVGYYNERVQFVASTYNFFGLPNTLTFFSGVNFNKYNLWAVGASYKYENIQATQINFKTDFVIEKLNKYVKVGVNRNFFNIKTAFAFNAQYAYDHKTISLTGNPRDPQSFVKAKSHYYSLWLAGALPVSKIMHCKDDKLKFIAATKINYTDYKTRPFLIDRNFAEIFVEQQNYLFGLGVARWDFYLEKNAFNIDIAEYFPRGISASLWTGFQIDEVYGKRTKIDLTANYGIYLKKFGFLYAQANYNGYIRNKKGEQMQTRLDLNYVSKKIPFAKHMYFRQILKGGTNLGFFIPEERYFNINELNGIRGFYSPTLKGSKSVTLSAECDLFLDKIVALSKGMVYLFCDMGWLSENGKKLLIESKYQYGIGAGIRIRSVDLGLPYLDFQFSFYPKGKDFDARIFQFRLYEQNNNAILHNNMFFENPSSFNTNNK